MNTTRLWSLLSYLTCISILLTACNFPITQASVSDNGTLARATATKEVPQATEEQHTPTDEIPQPSSTATVTITSTEEPPAVTASANANCRTGPNIIFDEYGYLLEGEAAPAVGRASDNSWYVVQLPDRPKPCWISTSIITIDFDPAVLSIVVSPPTPTPELGSISGVLWHEICEFTGGEMGEPLVLGRGCVTWGDPDHPDWGPNQVYDSFETGEVGVTLHIGAGACPSTGLGTAVTNANGFYSFSGLPAGTYCVSYSNLTDGNDVLLIPGGSTYPYRDTPEGYYQTVTLEAGEDKGNVNFGYASQWFN